MAGQLYRPQPSDPADMTVLMGSFASSVETELDRLEAVVSDSVRTSEVDKKLVTLRGSSIVPVALVPSKLPAVAAAGKPQTNVVGVSVGGANAAEIILTQDSLPDPLPGPVERSNSKDYISITKRIVGLSYSGSHPSDATSLISPFEAFNVPAGYRVDVMMSFGYQVYNGNVGKDEYLMPAVQHSPTLSGGTWTNVTHLSGSWMRGYMRDEKTTFVSRTIIDTFDNATGSSPRKVCMKVSAYSLQEGTALPANELRARTVLLTIIPLRWSLVPANKMNPNTNNVTIPLPQITTFDES